MLISSVESEMETPWEYLSAWKKKKATPDSLRACGNFKKKKKSFTKHVKYGCIFILIIPLGCMRVCCHVRLCDPMDFSPPGSFVHGIFQARIPKWVAIFYLLGTNIWFGVNFIYSHFSTWVWYFLCKGNLLFSLLQSHVGWAMWAEPRGRPGGRTQPEAPGPPGLLAQGY